MQSFDPPQARAAERDKMVSEQLFRRGIVSPSVLDALRRVPREWFLPPERTEKAYEDNAISIDCGQTISQPYMVGKMTELLELKPTDRVLEVGTGSGYQTAVLALLARYVYTIEWHLKLMTQAAESLAQLGVKNVMFRCGDGSRGWPEHAPFDAVLVTAGAPDFPTCLYEQLIEGGRLVAPVGPKDDQTLILATKTPSGPPQPKEILKCRFVKLWGTEGWRE